MWDPQQYLRYGAQRSRPFFELTARVSAESPRLVYDLGCGPGTLTAALAERWPTARVVGVDNDPAMLRDAARHATDRVSFQHGDLATFLPPPEADVVVSNAAYHWVEGHPDILRAIAHRLPADGWLALQVPGNFAAPSHTIIRDLLAEPRWASRVPTAGLPSDAVLSAAGYGEIFADEGLAIDTWETTYNQVLSGDDPVLEWVRGSTLRPILAQLDDAAQRELLDELRGRYAAAYPRTAAGVVLPFRRVFAVGHRPSATPTETG